MLIIERTSAAVPIIGTAGPVCRPALFLPGEVGNFLQADAAVLCVNSNVQFPVPVSGPEIFLLFRCVSLKKADILPQLELRSISAPPGAFCSERKRFRLLR